MADTHPIVDADKRFKIDPATRQIINESGKLILMQNDHNSERFTFEIPRYVEGHDMSLCNVVQIHYNNIDTSRRYQNSDIYVVDDLQVVSYPDTGESITDIVTGSWLISMNATTFTGTLEFIIRFACVADNGTVEYQWFSSIYSMIQIQKGIYNVDVVTNFDDKDILSEWKKEILNETMPKVLEVLDEAQEVLDSVNERITDTEFIPNFETGELEYISNTYTFTVNTRTGNLEWSVNDG